ncbi:tyrosine-type recombinase/integrase [Croceibacterium mercuriale]|uniref:tyrosine-type recombinase/integrase n=1 Tax=Croceibacterium mercuriale TaxID=1572751 RepID=UPI00068E8CC6
MRWSEVEYLDGPAPLWRVPPERLKLKRSKKDEARFEHLVPLSAAAVHVLREAASLHDRAISQNEDANLHAGDALVFSGRSGATPIGEGAIGELYQRAGFAGRHVPHGWRASFSTILNEQLGEGWSTSIDAALGHAKSDKVEAAYNRSTLLGRRRGLFDRWGQMLAG